MVLVVKRFDGKGFGPDIRTYSDRLCVHALSRFSHRLNVYPAHVHNEVKIGIVEARRRIPTFPTDCSHLGLEDIKI